MATNAQHTEPLSDLTAFQRDILTIIARVGAPYGLRIKRELEAEYGTDVNHGRLYPNLDDLVQMGLVEKSERDKRTNNYGLTERGNAVLEADTRWRREAIQGEEDNG